MSLYKFSDPPKEYLIHIQVVEDMVWKLWWPTWKKRNIRTKIGKIIQIENTVKIFKEPGRHEMFIQYVHTSSRRLDVTIKNILLKYIAWLIKENHEIEQFEITLPEGGRLHFFSHIDTVSFEGEEGNNWNQLCFTFYPTEQPNLILIEEDIKIMAERINI